MPELSLEFWIGIGFAAVALLVGLAVAIIMVESTKGEFRFVLFCFVCSSLVLVYGIGEWEMSVTWPARPRIFVGILAFALVAMLATEIMRWAHGRHLRANETASSVKKEHEPSTQSESSIPLVQKTSVFIDCQLFFFPVSVPPDSTINVMIVNPKINFGFFSFSNASTKNKKAWPSPGEAILLKKGMRGDSGYKCEISNHGPTLIEDIAIRFEIDFGTPKETSTHEIVLTPLDPGAKITFYMLNVCSVGASMIIPQKVSARVFGESLKREIELKNRARNIIELNGILMFSPSLYKWPQFPACS